MFNKWLEYVKEVAEERERKFNALLQRLCRDNLAVVLFGSRARGDYTPLSDWDLLVLTKTGNYRVEAGELGQIFWLPVDEVDRVLEFSMVVLDAVMEGRLLCGSEEVFAKVRDKVEAYIKSRGLVKTKSVWIRKDLL
ncbi:MAG: nucleotidyltransferase domain-containing protein [Pyrobaculum sp.]